MSKYLWRQSSERQISEKGHVGRFHFKPLRCWRILDFKVTYCSDGGEALVQCSCHRFKACKVGVWMAVYRLFYISLPQTVNTDREMCLDPKMLSNAISKGCLVFYHLNICLQMFHILLVLCVSSLNLLFSVGSDLVTSCQLPACSLPSKLPFWGIVVHSFRSKISLVPQLLLSSVYQLLLEVSRTPVWGLSEDRWPDSALCLRLSCEIPSCCSVESQTFTLHSSGLSFGSCCLLYLDTWRVSPFIKLKIFSSFKPLGKTSKLFKSQSFLLHI